MDILYLLVPLSILLVFVTGLIFWWALNSRQFDALDEASVRILKDDDNPANQTENEPAEQTG